MAIAHAITRSVRDSAALLDATAGPEIGDPYWAPPPKRSFQAEVGADPGPIPDFFWVIAAQTFSLPIPKTLSDRPL